MSVCISRSLKRINNECVTDNVTADVLTSNTSTRDIQPLMQ